MEKIKEHYLGDGLYASFDGSQIKLRAPRGDGDHEVFLEQDTLNELLRYVEKLKKDAARETGQ